MILKVKNANLFHRVWLHCAPWWHEARANAIFSTSSSPRLRLVLFFYCCRWMSERLRRTAYSLVTSSSILQLVHAESFFAVIAGTADAAIYAEWKRPAVSIMAHMKNTHNLLNLDCAYAVIWTHTHHSATLLLCSSADVLRMILPWSACRRRKRKRSFKEFTTMMLGAKF